MTCHDGSGCRASDSDERTLYASARLSLYDRNLARKSGQPPLTVGVGRSSQSDLPRHQPISNDLESLGNRYAIGIGTVHNACMNPSSNKRLDRCLRGRRDRERRCPRSRSIRSRTASPGSHPAMTRPGLPGPNVESSPSAITPSAASQSETDELASVATIRSPTVPILSGTPFAASWPLRTSTMGRVSPKSRDTGTSRAAAMAMAASTRGKCLPFSIDPINCLLTPDRAASSVCVRPARWRSVWSRCDMPVS